MEAMEAIQTPKMGVLYVYLTSRNTIQREDLQALREPDCLEVLTSTSYRWHRIEARDLND